MDKEKVVYKHNGILLSQMYVEIILLSEVSHKEISHDITQTWNLKYDTNELIYKKERDSQT